MKYFSISTLRFSSSQTLRRRDFLSSLNNRGINFEAIRLMARSSVKIAPDESEEMFTSSAISRIVKWRSTRFFNALEQPFVHFGLLKVGLDADRRTRILDPL
jgi:hypothetical protein